MQLTRRPGRGAAPTPATRGALGPVPVRAAGRRPARVRRMLRAARRLRARRDRPAHRRGAGRAARGHRPSRSSRRWPSSRRCAASKLGDMLLVRQIVTPEQLVAAIEQQARMPMVRIGEALIGAGLHHRGAARRGAGAAAQRPQRAAGRAAGAQGRGLARRPAGGAGAQDGLPAGRRRRRSRSSPRRVRAPAATRWRAALPALPLMLRGGRLVVAMEDPSPPQRRSTRSSSPRRCKVVPVLARAGVLAAAIERAYEKIGADCRAARHAPTSPAPIDFERRRRRASCCERWSSSRAPARRRGRGRRSSRATTRWCG
ncbi:MAG: hypothetical protein MZW92_57920 [Comamonadaceae bacterium]|nr:hypothetical protein [Comamonadaceae bacterium]